MGVVAIAMVSANGLAEERAERPSRIDAELAAPRNALELAVSGTYTQGLSSPAGGMSALDLTKAGGAIEVQIGYRVRPNLSFSVSAEYDRFLPGELLSSSASTRGLVVGANATYHLHPFHRMDPWARAGIGYRMLWAAGDGAMPNTLWHGFQFVKLNMGVDFRTTKDLAIGPMAGVDLSQFVWRNSAGESGDRQISDQRVVPFVYGGLQGRFDLFGTRTHGATPIAGVH
jgi:hypothetical protein